VPDGKKPTLFNAGNKVTPLFIEIQMCEKFHIEPLVNFCGPDAIWNSPEGRAIKILLFAYCQLNNEEEQRHLDEMKHDTNTDNNDLLKTPHRGRRG
jgi:hypothetical protein